jgi:L-alanine-DL-glutamate epimerase-like enolase superfamily enzyme
MDGWAFAVLQVSFSIALDAEAAASTMSGKTYFFLGRSAHDGSRNIKEFELFDRRWNHVPIYSYAPFDNACWDIVGKMAHQPVYELLGAAREKVSLCLVYVFAGPDEYVKQALEVKAKGYHGFRLHPPGDLKLDIECYRAVRDAVGDDFDLMADPVISYTYEEALKAGREASKVELSLALRSHSLTLISTD